MAWVFSSLVEHCCGFLALTKQYCYYSGSVSYRYYLQISEWFTWTACNVAVTHVCMHVASFYSLTLSHCESHINNIVAIYHSI